MSQVWSLDELAPWRAQVEQALRAYVDNHVDVDGTAPPTRLREAMAWALLGGGKRLRPLVCLSVASVLHEREQIEDALPAAVALELVHTYSLVHDDLPALDDDDLRRGRPTVHKAFDEATAVLAGDGLLTDAFAILARAPHHAARQIEELARAAGSAGMVGGQHDDMRNEGRSTSSSEPALREVHRRKTGRLFAAATATAALAVDRVAVVDAARRYGQLLGFAFQVQDDVLDVEGDVEKGGKPRGRDEKHDKLTYVRAVGLEGAKALARQAGEEAAAAAVVVGAQVQRDPQLLVHLARFAATRTH
ncbi:MAG: polyprenyl synthetase family protein [Deltaproteobacteria bacterium]|nr:polyprenyl synthetase family protein [Deltaproteobacteria bacterium]